MVDGSVFAREELIVKPPLDKKKSTIKREGTEISFQVYYEKKISRETVSDRF